MTFSLITFSPVTETKRLSDEVLNYCYKWMSMHKLSLSTSPNIFFIPFWIFGKKIEPIVLYLFNICFHQLPLLWKISTFQSLFQILNMEENSFNISTAPTFQGCKWTHSLWLAGRHSMGHRTLTFLLLWRKCRKYRLWDMQWHTGGIEYNYGIMNTFKKAYYRDRKINLYAT